MTHVQPMWRAGRHDLGILAGQRTTPLVQREGTGQTIITRYGLKQRLDKLESLATRREGSPP